MDDTAKRYLVVVRFTNREEPIPQRLREHVPLIHRALADLAEEPSVPEMAFKSADGTVVGIGVRTKSRPRQILAEVHAHKRGDPSPTRPGDQLFVLELGSDFVIEGAAPFAGFLNKA